MKNIFLPVLLGMAWLMGCRTSDPGAPAMAVYVPTAPDYADSVFWHIQTDDDRSGVDVFYIPSTWEYDWYTADSTVSHWADPYKSRHRADMDIEMTQVAGYMADGNRFYSPYYRHITLDSWATLNEDTINRRYHDVAFVDVKGAFQRYMSEYNQGRPFILAGFSQGGKSVVELMKVLDEDQRKRMVAAYVMGYKVTPEDVDTAPWIVGARDSVDTGVTVCYNSVSDVRYVKPVVSEPNVMCINPVNWRTDATPATLDDTMTVTVAPREKVLVVEGYDGSSLPNILDILNVGDYHGAEPSLYGECLRRNMKARIRAYKSKAGM